VMHASPAFSAKLVLVTGTVLVLLAAWQLADLLLLVFAAVLGAILLRALADLLARPTGLASGWSLVLAVVLIALVLALVVVFFGAAILQNIETLVERLPGAWRAVRDRIDSVGWVQAAVDRGTDAMLSGGVVSRIGGALGLVAGAITNLLLVIFGALYIAAQPALYRAGLLRLVPPRHRDRADRTLCRCGEALRGWLLGQVIAMVGVGVVTTVGLWALGVPSFLALGLFAGLAEFVPIVGPVAAAIPAVVIALSVDPTLALWVVGLFLLIQQIEGNVLQPLIQREIVEVPPALLLFAVVGFGVLFGGLGVLLAAPLTVVAYVAAQDLYVAPLERHADTTATTATATAAEPRSVTESR
ncbi:AI-2E family transporter, partial [Rhodoplanes serenus]